MCLANSDLCLYKSVFHKLAIKKKNANIANCVLAGPFKVTRPMKYAVAISVNSIVNIMENKLCLVRIAIEYFKSNLEIHSKQQYL